MSTATILKMVKGIYNDIDSGKTENYSKNFIEDLKRVRGEINKQISLLKDCGVAYSDEAMMKILENVGVKKYF